jgi:hypothetical protein
MVIVDTDILIWILRGRKEIIEKFKSLIVKYDGHVFITPVQVAEIYAGLKGNEEEKVTAFLRTLRTIPIDYETGRLAGEFMKKYRKSHNITIADSLVAASAKVHSFGLWTLNKKHYPMFKSDELIM